MNKDAEKIEVTINGFKEKVIKGSSITELILVHDEMGVCHDGGAERTVRLSPGL